jgi:carbamoyl-phosphate synthase large subunit
MAVNPADGELMIIEMNPRVSRSSALASKATGFPIAKMAAKLAVGCTLDGIPNDITLKTPASFEPSIDYVITKIPRFAFEKFPGSEPVLTTQMKSVGEAMAVGRTWQESFNKALRSLETGLNGWGLNAKDGEMLGDKEALKKALTVPNPARVVAIHEAFMSGMTAEEIRKLTDFDPWYLRQMEDLFQTENWLKGLSGVSDLDKQDWLEVKRRGFSDIQIARALNITEGEVRKARLGHDVRASMKRVDTCAAEFEAETPYMYSSYDGNDEVAPTEKRKILILGGGPNRIGQGIEFDYCCCHAAFALKDAGYETIMLNSNPETVSTDYDTSDRLYFEPLTVEDVLNVVEAERPEGIIVQFGGQTPLSLATRLEKALKDSPIPAASGNGNCRILGTPPRQHRRRGGSREVAGDSRGARHPPAPRRRRALRGGGARRGEQHRVPRHGASLVRARWPRDGNRLLRCRLEAVHHYRRRGGPRETRARGQVPEQRHRARRRRALRRGGQRRDRRHHGTHRAGWCALR